VKTKSVKILVVDDDDKILFAFKEVLKKEGYSTILSNNSYEALEKISSEQPTIIFMDITMPMLNGLEALNLIKQKNPFLPVIIITGYGTMQTAIKAMQNGAFEYLTKPLDVEKIREVTRRALSSVRSHAAPMEQRFTFNADILDRYELVGNSAAMLEIYKLIGSISTTPNHTSVLIVGESGTGKELVARTIHNNSPNSQEAFIGINCTVLPEALLESELYGYEKGAFTGAGERKLGKFEIAGKGTIFLDEIGNLSPSLQQKLLRVLQEREFERLGGNIPIHVDARFVAATNQDIESEVKKGNFREDLYYRLNVAAINLPTLRERKEDIRILSDYFLSKYNEQLKKSVKGFSDNSMKLLQSYSFPGNVRELENLVERAVMLTKGEVILPDVLIEVSLSKSAESALLPISSPVFSESRDYILKTFEKQFLIEQLSKYHGNVTAAAKNSKMTRQNFQRLMKKHNIQAGQFRN
jgi:two-component system, NtrC family, response regulator AtoC